MPAQILKIFKPPIIDSITLWFRGKIYRFLKFILLTFLSFILTISFTPVASGQISFLNIKPTRNEKNIIDIVNRPEKCNNFVCSKVWFYGIPIFEVASYPTNKQNKEQLSPAIENRAKQIQNNLKRILKLILNPSKTSETIIPNQSNHNIEKVTVKSKDYRTQKTNYRQNQALQTNAIEIKLKTVINQNNPKIKVGIYQGETVVYFPEQLESPQQIIATVTKADALYYNRTREQVAQLWQNQINLLINWALKERDFDTKYIFLKPLIILTLIIVMNLVSFAVLWMQRYCKSYYINIRHQLQDLNKSLRRIDPEFATTEELATIVSEPNLQLNQKQNSHTNNSNISENINKNLLFNSGKANQIFLNLTLKLLLKSLPEFFLKKQNFLIQQLNILSLIRRFLRWVQGFIWVWGIGIIMFLYPQTRAISFLLIAEPISILVIWISVSFADKVSDFAIEWYLNRWAENAQLANPNSGRYALRVATYSSALTNMTTILAWIIGIVATADKLGIATEVLASAGVIAAVSAYFSQNLIKDVINGALILWNDRYAVGDVVNIGGEGGLVEAMNLYMSALRNADGELITIPHSSISIVKNLTKDWSRVNFTIEIAYDADIKKAMQIIQEVAKKMQNQVEWQDSFIEPTAVLGVDEISHSGILIRVWIKTPPLKQWALGREFRLRVKQAFDREGIAIGVPQRSLSVQNFSDFTNEKENGNGKDEPKSSSVN
ncbi:MAG: mechanosensitive ion channel family protein [Microcoleaceae cyanobacterium]